MIVGEQIRRKGGAPRLGDFLKKLVKKGGKKDFGDIGKKKTLPRTRGHGRGGGPTPRNKGERIGGGTKVSMEVKGWALRRKGNRVDEMQKCAELEAGKSQKTKRSGKFVQRMTKISQKKWGEREECAALVRERGVLRPSSL